jgi:hypothetical protein
MINPEEISSNSRASSGTIYNFVGAFNGSLDSGGITNIPNYNLN